MPQNKIHNEGRSLTAGSSIAFPQMPAEQQTIQALEQLKQLLTHMDVLRQNLSALDNSFMRLPQSRRLKISPLHRENQSDPYHIVPHLHLCGDWLQETGFECYNHVRIITLQRLLLIFPEQKKEALPARRRRLG